MVNTIADFSVLYPIVHDLDDDYDGDQQSCCNLDILLDACNCNQFAPDSYPEAPVPANRRISEKEKRDPTFDNCHVKTRELNVTCSNGSYWETIDCQSGLRRVTKICNRQFAEVYNEVAVLKKLSTVEGVLHMHDFFQERSRLYLVLDRFDSTLSKCEEEKAKKICAELLKTLETLHNRNVVQRNITPESIFLLSSDRVALGNFGHAVTKNEGESLTAKLHSTSIYYQAPELCKNHPKYTTQVDMWSLGVVLYQILVGRLPFEGTRKSVQQKIAKGTVKYDSSISRTCKNFIQSLLKVDPKKRATATQALQHPWIVTPNLSDDDDTASGISKTKHTRRVWFALKGETAPKRGILRNNKEEGSCSTLSIDSDYA